MWPHFWHLFFRILRGMPLLVSSNWAAWILGAVVFLLYEIGALVVRGRQDMRQRWAQNIGIGLLATLCGYVLLFAASAIITTYDEHHDSTGRWEAVVNEKNSLKATLQERDDYIHKLEARQCPTCTTHAKSGAVAPAVPQAPPPMVGNVRVASQKTVVSTNKDFPYALEVVLQTDASIEPVAFGIECDGDIGAGSAGFSSGGMYVQSKMGFVNNSTRLWGFEWKSPAFTPDSPIIVTLFSKSYIRVIQLQQLRYSWP